MSQLRHSNLFKETRFGFRTEGKLVVMTIDDTDIAMDYALAFKVSASLNQVARKAKRLAGDISVHMNMIATLTDANADELEQQIERDGTSAFIPRSTLTDS